MAALMNCKSRKNCVAEITFRRVVEMKNIFVFVLCLSVVCGSFVFAESTKKEDLQKKVAEIKAKQAEVAVRLAEITSQYATSSKKVQSLRKELRKGKLINSNYDKTGVDEETADLIDRFRDAEKRYAEVKKELDEHLAKSDAGIARVKKYEDSLGLLKEEKQSLRDIIQKRAEVLQEQRKIDDELAAAEVALLEQSTEASVDDSE